MVDAYIAAPKPKIQKVWSCFEEEDLLKLKSQDIPLQETAIGTATAQMARAVTNHIAQLDKKTVADLREAIGTLDSTNVL